MNMKDKLCGTIVGGMKFRDAVQGSSETKEERAQFYREVAEILRRQKAYLPVFKRKSIKSRLWNCLTAPKISYLAFIPNLVMLVILVVYWSLR